MLLKKEIWVKAAVEHRILNINYFSSTKHEHTTRDVEPDFVGTSVDGKNDGLWTTYCHLRQEGPRCFHPETITQISVTEHTFVPSPRGRWKELIPFYEKQGLKDKDF